MREGLPLSYRGPGGDPPGKNWEIVVPEKHFLSLFEVKMSGFKLNFESHFDTLYAMFCLNFSLYWCCSLHTKKKKGNDQDLTKYLINDCSSFWFMVYKLCCLLQSVPYHPPAPLQKKCTLSPLLPPPHKKKKKKKDRR